MFSSFPFVDLQVSNGPTVRRLRFTMSASIPQPFIAFGPAHLTVLALTILIPVLLAWWARHLRSTKFADRVCTGFCATIIGVWALWYVVAYREGWLDWGDGLPFDLCSWAAIASILAMLTRRQSVFELAYFWAMAGTVQGALTPNVPYDFPEIRFVIFSVFHGSIIASVLFMALAMKMRPTARAIPRAYAWTLFYAMSAGAVDWALQVNYGFLRAKPTQESLFDLLPGWPYYIPVMAVLALLSLFVCYAPYYVLDRMAARRAALVITSQKDGRAQV